MGLPVVGAGLPRTGTSSARTALQRLLGGPCYHMSAIPGHPFDLGPSWSAALRNDPVEWDAVFAGFAAAVDWPTSMYWQRTSETYPDAVILLSVRDDARTWWESMDATVLKAARWALASDWTDGRDLLDLLSRFVRSPDWDDPSLLMAAYERHAEEVRRTAPADRLIEWRAADGWSPLCEALRVDVPAEDFPWTNRREGWS